MGFRKDIAMVSRLLERHVSCLGHVRNMTHADAQGKLLLETYDTLNPRQLVDGAPRFQWASRYAWPHRQTFSTYQCTMRHCCMASRP
eukprot:scaffold641499_cov29-Prasinocladus_malaysianus.AAC.1